MASTVEAARLTETQRRDQVRVAKELIVSLRAMWTLLNPADLDGSTSTWLTFAVARLEAAHSESARIALAYLQGFRRLEIGAPLTAFESIRVPLRNPEVALYFTGPVKVKQGMTAGLTLGRATSLAFKEMSRTAQMLALNGGRDTIKAGIRRDRKALGYQRVTDGSPCYFCAMLASRGPVYNKHSFTNTRVHIGCGCTLEPVYARDTEWAGRSREYADIYANVTPGANQSVVAAFRQAYNSQR